MGRQTAYECEKCGNQIEQEATELKAPECCGRAMAVQEPLPVCNTSTTAEHSRMDIIEEPCDDGRSGKI